jgi:hypothetical protein
MRKQVTPHKYKYAMITYAVALTGGSLQPLRPGGQHDSEIHQLLHFVCFGVLVLLAWGAFPGRRSLVWIVLACILFGATLEFLQHWEFREAMEWNDVRDDAIGVGVAGLLCLFW